MKKLIITALCLVCALGLGACSDTADAGDTTKDGVIGDGFRDDLNDMRDGLEDMLDGTVNYIFIIYFYFFVF
ncbi:MAG: hypothetical protein II668_02470 [Oscillospiraceae bacterium]|nr:hypothetical protein [Oscillospiraceae bacterium]